MLSVAEISETSKEKIDRPKADGIGMLATIMNCMYVSEIFRTEGMDTEVFTLFICGRWTRLFSKDEAIAGLKAGKVCFLQVVRTSIFFNRYDNGVKGYRNRG